MSNTPASNWSIFRILCRVIGGRGTPALNTCTDSGLLSRLVETAEFEDMLPALAVRYIEQLGDIGTTEFPQGRQLVQALHENTRRNLQATAQALKLTRQLNKAGITPVFLKGSIQLLNPETHNIGFRKQVDIDLLVEPEEIAAASAVLLANGYGFYQGTDAKSGKTTLLTDAGAAIKASAAHHHLPPLIKEGYASTVELHQHFLPKRFQRNNPLQPVLATASHQENHGAIYRIPSTEFQLIHLILGKLVHDGHLARRAFPLREACDFIHLMQNLETDRELKLVAQHCGKDFWIFSALVAELMPHNPLQTITSQIDISNRVRLMQKRYNTPAVSALLNHYARAQHLSLSLIHNPAKLSGYVGRLFSEA